jgi:acetyl esterase
MSEVRELEIELDGRTLRARLYVPSDDETLALMLYFHGGAFIVGDLDTHDSLCRRLAADTKMRLLSLEYRLAPEHPFPAAVNDAIDALRRVACNVETFASSEVPVIIVGDSAGATLAAVAAASTRGEGLSIAAQVLISPTLGPEIVTDSAHAYGTGYLLDTDQLRYDYELYLGEYTNHTDPRVAPLMALDLTGSPPAIVVVAQCDPLRDEGVAYAGLLEHFGTPVEILEASGMIHGFLRLGAIVPDALSIVDDLAAHLHRLVEASA